MFFKFFSYSLERDGQEIPADEHLKNFRASRGKDENGEFVNYRGQRNSVLMSVKKSGDVFTGLVGKYSDKREITDYDNNEDETKQISVRDNDYPNTPFVCAPKLKGIAIGDSSPVVATSAIRRLHAILQSRANATFVAEPIKNIDDLRFATNAFKVTEISFETYPVNPHTGVLGKLWDRASKRDHVKKVVGRLFGTAEKPIKLNRGLASQIQQLQASGHSKVGYTAIGNDGLELKLPKPREIRPTSPDEGIVQSGLPDVRVKLREFGDQYPLSNDEINRVLRALRALLSASQ